MLLCVHLRLHGQVIDLALSAFALLLSACWIPRAIVSLALTLSDPMTSDCWGQGWSGVRGVFWPCALCGGVGAPCCRTLAGELRKHLVTIAEVAFVVFRGM